jgi:hypothetical protein
LLGIDTRVNYRVLQSMGKSNKTDYYSSASIKKDLLERSRARAEHRSKPVYKVIGKSAKVLKKTVVPVTIKSGGSGFTTCCGKRDCAICGEIPRKSYVSLPYIGFWSEKQKNWYTKTREIADWAFEEGIRPIRPYSSERGAWAISELRAEKRIAEGKKAVHKNQVKINNK